MDAQTDDESATNAVRARIDKNADVLTQLQVRLHEISTQMMTYVGILQRDAPVITSNMKEELEMLKGGPVPASLVGAIGGAETSNMSPLASSPRVVSSAAAASPKSGDTRTTHGQGFAAYTAVNQARRFASDIVTTSKRIDILVSQVQETIEAKLQTQADELEKANQDRKMQKKRLRETVEKSETVLKVVGHMLEVFNSQVEAQEEPLAKEGRLVDFKTEHAEMVKKEAKENDPGVFHPAGQDKVGGDINHGGKQDLVENDFKPLGPDGKGPDSAEKESDDPLESKAEGSSSMDDMKDIDDLEMEPFL